MLSLGRDKIMATNLSIEYGKKIFPYLVQAAKANKTITYKELAEKIGVHHRAMGIALGYVRDEVCIPKGLPLISCIVVNGGTGLPGESWLPQGTSSLNPEAYEAEFIKYRDQVMNFQSWDEILEDLELSPIDSTEENLDDLGRAFSEFHERVGIRESSAHQILKESIISHPELIGLPPEIAVITDYRYVTGDQADIVFGTSPGIWAVVEVKEEDIGELVMGVYQLVKYRALLQAEKGHNEYAEVDAFLVSSKIPADVSFFAAKLGIRCKIIRKENI